MTKSKLYTLTKEDFVLPHYVDTQHNVFTREAADIPMMSWPDGTWCMPANIYMLKLFERGLSRTNEGGTLKSYATNISHLLRYIFDNRIEINELTDNEFTLFIKMLQGEKQQNNPEKFVRNSNAVNAIGINCLEFLHTVGQLYQNPNYIGPTGQIRATEKIHEVKIGGSKNGALKISRKCWTHRSFPTPDPERKRLPISSVAIEKLRQIILPSSPSIFLRKRRYILLKLLEITGGRRSEVAALTCASVRRAAKMANPMLNMITVKKRKVETREIPIAKHDVAFLVDYIETNRRRIVRSTCGLHHDDGYLLVNERTGKKIRANTVTQEISYLSKEAGISEKSCPHMFRHRFITKLFVALIEQHEFENTDSFRRALLDMESIKQKIQQLTGHTNLSSLDVYIDLAFDELTNFKTTFDIVNTKNVVSSFKGTLSQLKEELNHGGSFTDISTRLEKYLSEFEADLNRTLIAPEKL